MDDDLYCLAADFRTLHIVADALNRVVTPLIDQDELRSVRAKIAEWAEMLHEEIDK